MKNTILAFAMMIVLSTISFGQEVVYGHKATNFNITEEMVINAQKAWSESLLKISKTHMDGGDYKKVANEALDKGYNYENGIVLFKPTLTTGDQTFRLDKEGALAYFVGGNPKYPNDTGFALKGWVRYVTKNSGIILNGSTAISMGNIYLYDKAGNETVVDKTWGFKMNELGQLKIVLHHSSLPYKPAATATKAK
ncbi:MAG: phosphoribosyl-AMP cyclohydrolase [Blastocatellia bacterium]|nr:phosphoribosyl-AMP cyclohydrolase [Blastocatellia bacterium]